jgi:peptidoglycan/LPS O-acetylase OafA/YrhL
MDGTDGTSPAAGVGAASEFRLGHLRWLDGVRGIAILMVLAYHFGLLKGGFLGVDVFFVLSGFLITALLAEEWGRRGAVSLGRFYARRALRLVPAMVVLLLASYVYTRVARPPYELPAVRKAIAIVACQLSNWQAFHVVPLPALGHTWSLSLEEQFYLAWPTALCLILRSGLGRRRVVVLTALGVATCACYRALLFGWYRSAGGLRDLDWHRLYGGLDTRADALLSGCLLGLLVSWGMLPRSPRFRAWAGVASLASLGLLGGLAASTRFADPRYYLGGFTAVALMNAAILARLLTGPVRYLSPLLECGPLVWTGRVSYGLYLYHIPAMRWLRQAGLGWGYAAETALIAATTFAVAALSYYCLERPCLRLKRRVRAPSPADAVSPAESNRPRLAA